MTRVDASDSVGCVTTTSPETERVHRIRWCACGQPWLPAVGLYGTTEETECPACILRRMLVEERGARPGVVKAKPPLFTGNARQFALRAVTLCQAYAVEHPEHAGAAAEIAVRITQEAKRG